MVSIPSVGHETHQWKRLLDLAGLGTVLVTPDMRFGLVNEAFARMHGFTVAELEGRPITDVFPAAGYAELSEKLRETRDRGHCRWNSESVRKDGSLFPSVVDFMAFQSERGELVYVAGSVQDLTEEKKTEAVRQRLACLVESTDEAISSQRLDGIVLDWNAAAERLFGYAAGEIVGRSINAIVPEELRAERSALTERALAGEVLVGVETERVRKDGRRIPIAITLSPIRDAAGNVLAISSIQRDISERKKAEELGALLTSLVQSSDDAITAQAFDGTVLDWNAGAERVYGYTESEIVGRSIMAIVPEDRRSERAILTERVVAGERIIGFETERVTKAGRRLAIALTLSPIRERTGRLLGISTIERDMTEQKEAQKKAELLASLVQSSSDAITAQAFDGTILEWNAGAERVYGYTEAESLGRSIITAIVPEDRREEREELTKRVMAGDLIIDRETERVTKDGKRIPIALTLSPIRDPAGRVLGVSTIERDITEQKRSQKLGALLTSLVQSSDDAITAHALDGTVLDWNAAAERIFGYAAPEMLGRPVTCIVPEDRRGECEALIQRALSGERVVGVETERVTKDGKRIAVALTLSPIRDRAGRVLGISTIQRDITLLKQLERDRAEWSSAVGHDLRQPTAAIRLASEALARSQLDAPHQRALERIERATEHLERMIQDLLDVSRTDAHRLTVNPHATDLAPLIREVVELTPEAAGRCRIDVAPDAATASADPERLIQVLSNLLSNACKYGDPSTPIEVSVQPAGEMAMITVTNDGPGISADELPNLFSRFVRTRSAQAGEVPGLGLGLYICRGIVEAHGGKLWGESVPGCKTHFRFTLPRVHAATDDDRRAGA